MLRITVTEGNKGIGVKINGKRVIPHVWDKTMGKGRACLAEKLLEIAKRRGKKMGRRRGFWYESEWYRVEVSEQTVIRLAKECAKKYKQKSAALDFLAAVQRYIS